jgi:hypothetical protein
LPSQNVPLHWHFKEEIMSKRIVSATSFVVFSMLQACSPLVQEHGGHDAGTNVKEILFSISEVSPTKSSISPQEGLIENVAVYAYAL